MYGMKIYIIMCIEKYLIILLKRWRKWYYEEELMKKMKEIYWNNEEYLILTMKMKIWQIWYDKYMKKEIIDLDKYYSNEEVNEMTIDDMKYYENYYY